MNQYEKNKNNMYDGPRLARGFAFVDTKAVLVRKIDKT